MANLLTRLPVGPEVTGAVLAQRTSLADRMRRSSTGNPLWDYAPDISNPAAGTQIPNPGPLPVPREDREPIRWQFPYSYNAQITPRGVGATTPFAVLRSLSDVCDIIRICIETRKDQMTSLEWDIVAVEAKAKLGPEALKVQANLKKFWKRPDGKRTFSTWFRAAIEEVLVVDALSIYRRRNYGGQLVSLELKDGSTILPMLDRYGDTPDPPAAAYRQVVYGAPIIDMTTDQLMYRPRTVRTNTPYGLSATEAVLLTVNSMLSREVFNLQYYAEGNIPEGILDAPAGWSPTQIREAQDILDENLAGNLKARRRLRIVGNGMAKSVYQFKEPDFAGVYDKWLMNIVCASFAVPPSEIGFTEHVNRATGQNQENVVYRRGVRPLDGFFTDLFNEVNEFDHGVTDFVFQFKGGEAEDELVKAQTRQIELHNGARDLDTWRQELGEDAVGIGPIFMMPTGPISVASFNRDEEAAQAAQPKRVEQAKESGNAKGGPPAPNPFAANSAGGAPGGKPGGEGGPGNGSPSGEKAEPKPATNIPQAEQPTRKATWPDPGWMQQAEVAADGRAIRGVTTPDWVDQDEAVTSDVEKELTQFRRVAIKRVKAGQPVKFTAQHLPQPVVSVILKSLEHAQSVDDVVRMFDVARPAVTGARMATAVRRSIDRATQPNVIHVHPPKVEVHPVITVEAPRLPAAKHFIKDAGGAITGVRYEERP